MVRLRFQGIQKKTKKNLNCNNPKFYEIFRFPLAKVLPAELKLVIQVIIVEQTDVWRVIA